MRDKYVHVGQSLDRACLAYAEEQRLNAKALMAARAVGMPTYSDVHRTLADHVAKLERERAWALALARRYRDVAASKGIRTRADDSKMVVDKASTVVDNGSL